MNTQFAVVALATLSLLTASTSTWADDIVVYPRDIFPNGPLNPRVPNIAPVDGGAKGKHVTFGNTSFNYPLAPLVRFPKGGCVRMSFQHNRTGLRLIGDTRELGFGNSPGKKPHLQLVLAEGKKNLAVIPVPSGKWKDWTTAEIRWDAKSLSLSIAGKLVKTVPLALKRPFEPTNVKIHPTLIDELSIAGDGELRLDWERGYGATVTPASSSSSVTAELLGFDTLVVSQDPTKRDFPILHVINASATEKTVTVDFEVYGEVDGYKKRSWRQKITVPARSMTAQPVRFPAGLGTDVYHLSAKTSDTTSSWSVRKHFMHVSRRDEKPGPEKFGLNYFACRVFGYWPDALPIHLSRQYLIWSWIVAPPWAKKADGTYDLGPDVPVEKWGWLTYGVDRMIAEGRTMLVVLESTPYFPWMRSKEYTKKSGVHFNMRKHGWGDWSGGPRNLKHYRRFVREAVKRYKGKVAYYEIENEPNSMLKPEDYVQVAKVVYEEVKAGDPGAKVIGISGTGNFVPWMRKVFTLGGHKYMDGVSWHTYTGARLPDEINLTGKLAAARKIMNASGRRRMPALNSETGVWTALREKVDRPISEDRLAELIQQGILPLKVATEPWVDRAYSERRAGISMITNAVTNFLAGTEYFLIWGWDPTSPKNPMWWNVRQRFAGWGIFSASREGERTPSRFSLAVGVMTAQLEPAFHLKGRPVDLGNIRGAIFPKAGGGEVAVLWSRSGRRTISFRSPGGRPEVVTMLGKNDDEAAREIGQSGVFMIDVGETPLYVHTRGSGMTILPSPVESVCVRPTAIGKGKMVLTLRNVFGQAWQGRVEFKENPRCVLSPARTGFAIAAGKTKTLQFTFAAAPGTTKGKFVQTFHLILPNGSRYTSAVTIPIVPVVPVRPLPRDLTLRDISRRPAVAGDAMRLHRVDQVVHGRPHALASLKKASDWGGPEELSGAARIGYNDTGLFVYVEVQDAHPRRPKPWPGIQGSCVEVFLDFRKAGLGDPGYNRDVHQLLIRPSLGPGQKPLVHSASPHSAPLPGVTVAGLRTSKTTYWVGVHVPWTAIGRVLAPGEQFGFDVAIGGPFAGDTPRRKSQLALFGTADNFRDASHFAIGVIEPGSKR